MQNQEEQNRKAVLLCLQTLFEGWNGTARAVLCRSMSPTGRQPGSHFSAVLPRNPTVSTAGVELDSLNSQADRAVFLVSRSARLHTQTGQGPGPGRSSDVPSLGSVSCRRQHRAQGTGHKHRHRHRHKHRHSLQNGGLQPTFCWCSCSSSWIPQVSRLHSHLTSASASATRHSLFAFATPTTPPIARPRVPC